ncbi:hypothetical protein M0R45_019851 [Rubus argutus]|uniref:Large ribosomal subunit protein bL25 beta domain-containing protein n=1 Tax=Rubus argutus TaxID=59490 RepID=A0AAW1X9T0_RUBAR
MRAPWVWEFHDSWEELHLDESSFGSHLNERRVRGAYLHTFKRMVKFRCPADVIPPYIDMDLSELDAGQELVMGDLKVHPTLKLLQSKDEPICKFEGSRVCDQQKKIK